MAAAARIARAQGEAIRFELAMAERRIAGHRGQALRHSSSSAGKTCRWSASRSAAKSMNVELTNRRYVCAEAGTMAHLFRAGTPAAVRPPQG